jgi:hypothetical protein
MTDLYSPIILNPQRNANTTLQSSTLESANSLNKVFDIQAVRTIKGRVFFPGSSPYGYLYSWRGGVTQNAVVVNEYDRSPVNFNPGDIVVSVVATNGNYKDISGYPNPYNYPSPFTEGTIQLYCTEEPTYSSRYKIWSTSPYIDPLTLPMDVTKFGEYFIDRVTTPVSQTMQLATNSACGSANNTSAGCYGGQYQWLSCYGRGIKCPYYSSGSAAALSTFTPYMVGINFTILVINPL